jgi:hypothetical protein
MLPTQTIPSQQGTLAKRTKPTLQPNFAKEPFRPSRSDAGLRDSVSMTDKQIEYKNRQCLTHNIANKGFSGIRRFVARLNFSCTLTGNRPQSLTGHIVNR